MPLLISVFLTLILHAQQKPAGGFKLFFEKVYLHIDRNYYASGDNIWFKAYLVNAQSNHNTGSSNNLYVELISPDSKLVTREIVRMDDGYGKGDFKLGDSIPGGVYHIRAYTSWMKNFGTHFIFDKDIQVHSIQDASRTKTPIITSAKNPPYKIQFFPEGGTLVEGLKTIVSFKAEGVEGKGVDARGYIISSKGDTAVQFKTSHLGMGSFAFKPLAGEAYKVKVQYRNSLFTPAELPDIYVDGYVMNITNLDTTIVANIQANAATLTAHPSGEVTVAGRHAGRVFYKEKVTLKDGLAMINISKDIFPNGIAAITLYDEKLRPYSERLVYVDNKNQDVNLAVTTDKTTYQSKEKITVNITATDAQQEPVKAALSMAAVDEGIVKKSSTNILSYLNVESEVKGNIEDAADYFDEKNSNATAQLDLLLRTQGWRSYVWRQIADTSLKIRFMPEAGISISGEVRQLFANRPLANMNITLFATHAKGDKLYTTRTDSSGKFYLDGLPLYGSQPIKINSRNNKGEKGGILTMDSFQDGQLPFYQVPNTSVDNSDDMNKFAEEAAKRWLTTKQASVNNSTLPDVVVKAEQKKVITMRDGESYVSFGYPEYKFAPTKEDYKDYGTLTNLLIHKIPGAVTDVDSEGVVFYANGKALRPRFIVDNKEDVFERMDYFQLPLDQLDNVTVNHYISSSMNDVFVVNLTVKPGAGNRDMALLITDVNGYYEARTFYAPTYLLSRERAKPDVRTTIFWEPEIVTDENGKATVTFYNADPKTTIRIGVEGLSSKGVPVSAVTKYDIK